MNLWFPLQAQTGLQRKGSLAVSLPMAPSLFFIIRSFAARLGFEGRYCDLC